MTAASLITSSGSGAPGSDTSNVTPPPRHQEGSGGNGRGGGSGGGGGGNGGGGSGGNPGAGPPPGPGLDRTPSEQQFSGVPPLGETRFVANEILLQIPASVTRAQVEAIAKNLGVEIGATDPLALTGRTLYRFRMADGQDIRTLIRGLEANRIVSSAQPNYVFQLAQGSAATAPATTPDLAELASRGLGLTGDPGQYVVQKLHLGEVHRLARGVNVPVAVIDSEIDTRHPDLSGVVTERYDPTGLPSAPHLHGTGMAGAIASHVRLLGVAPGVRILAVRAFGEGATPEATSTRVLQGLDWAIAHGARVINMSFAGPRDLMTERVMAAAVEKGIVLVAAAGNAGPKSPPLYPAADPNVIAVTATDDTDAPFRLGNRGAYIDVAAPGVDVLVPSAGGSYQLTTGTSVASAHVSGVAALLIEAKPGIKPAEVRDILRRTATPLGPRTDTQTGAGLVDPEKALESIRPATAGPAGAAPGAAPAVVPAAPRN
ncbi:peptidase S8 and S53, subtilisin, kexin, sedolisin [Rhodovulum sp. PH10]|nr:peptidase S8 and S53, subtilisin, kexin, sedolisin [Rhodovulum sp. PH10]